VATDFAIEFLERQRSEPFLLVVGFKTPHGPRRPQAVPRQQLGRYAGARIAPPRSREAHPPFPRPRSARGLGGSGRRLGTGRDTYLYLELLTAVDASVGRLLAALEALELRERTIVVFTSDNGYYLGEHGLSDKRSGYDESMRIPLLVSGPPLGAAAASRVVDSLVLNLDLAPTLLELAGLPIPESLQGRSVEPLLDGRSEPWRRAFLYQYVAEPGFPQPGVLAVRTPAAKLIHYPDHEAWTELFDLESDPDEMHNLAREPERAALRKALQAELALQAQQIGLELPPDVTPRTAPPNEP
jgi:arylsulfatase A-like enzyme